MKVINHLLNKVKQLVSKIKRSLKFKTKLKDRHQTKIKPTYKKRNIYKLCNILLYIAEKFAQIFSYIFFILLLLIISSDSFDLRYVIVLGLLFMLYISISIILNSLRK